ncbi:hypothetical protein [Streptomyces vinaceus]|uniref:hypothetical protein n=1 Tax=Streptomyces vinaceus TaxID=1960 RepID=UPI00367813A7
MGFILLGHGALVLDPASPPDMETVGIPRGTTLQFYSDTGQRLVFGPDELGMWEQLDTPWPALDHTHVTYNLTLGSVDRQTREWLLQEKRQFGDHTLVTPGFDGLPDRIRLCTGTPETCGRTPQDIEEGRTHACDGLLGRYNGDLFWVACTAILHTGRIDPSVLEAAAAGAPTHVVLGDPPDWTPLETEQQDIAGTNAANVAAVGGQGFLRYTIGGTVFLIHGAHAHVPLHLRYASYQADVVEGTVMVCKADGVMRHTDWLAVLHVPPHHRELVEVAVRRFSDREVVFF